MRLMIKGGRSVDENATRLAQLYLGPYLDTGDCLRPMSTEDGKTLEEKRAELIASHEQMLQYVRKQLHK